MKKISLFLFSLLMMFSLCINVKAEDKNDGSTSGTLDVNGEGTSGDIDDGVSSDLPLSNSIPGWSSGKIAIGIRVTFLKNDGTELKVTDYIIQDTGNSYYSLGKRNYYASNHSKVYYATGTPNFVKNGANIGNNSDLGSLFEKYNFRPINLQNFLRAQMGSNSNAPYTYKVSAAKEWFLNSNHIGSDDTYEEDLKGLIRELLGSASSQIDLDDREQLQRLFVVVEPTSLVFFGENSDNIDDLYYGTAYELAYIASKAKEDGYTTYKYGNSALSSFMTLLGKNMPCSSYLTGELINTIKLKEDVNFIDFNSKYFGVLSKADKNVCTVQYLDKEIITGRYAVGMAIVWFYDLLPSKINPTCPYVNEVLDVDPSNISCNNKTTFEQLVSDFKNQADANKYNIDLVTVDWYMNCGCKNEDITPGSYNCTPVMNVGTCINNLYSNSVYYKDSSNGTIDEDYWKNCVFSEGSYDTTLGDNHKFSSTNRGYTYYESSLGDSEFCPVYCIEELTANFDDRVKSVLAGHHFIWGDSEVNGSRTCKTKKIDYELYTEQLEAANQAVVDAQAYLLLQEELANITYTNESNQADCDWQCHVPLVDPNDCECGDAKVCNEGEEDCVPKEDSKNCECGYKTLCPNNNGSYRGNWKIPSKYSIGQTETMVTSSSGEYTAYEQKYIGKYCSSIGSGVESDVASAQKALKEAIDDVKGVVNRMKNCFEWDNNTIYNTSPTVDISYSDGTYTYKAKLEEIIERKQVNDSDSSKCTGYNTSDIQVTGCSGKTCSTASAAVNICTFRSETREITQEFKLSDNAYRYVSKDGNLSVHSISDLNGDDYIGISYGNLPVAYKTPDGYHSRNLNNGDLTIEYYNLGHIKSDSSIVNNILSNFKKDDYGIWSCQYYVDSELITKELGLKVVYRTIDLKNPFPDINGQGRNVGSNWCAFTGINRCSNTNSVVQEVILNKQDIYTKEPMYSFILTPSSIKAIRSYNDSHKYDDFNLECNDGTGEACISDFLKNLKGNSLNGLNIDVSVDGNGNMGTCMQDEYRTTDVNKFNSCQN